MSKRSSLNKVMTMLAGLGCMSSLVFCGLMAFRAHGTDRQVYTTGGVAWVLLLQAMVRDE